MQEYYQAFPGFSHLVQKVMHAAREWNCRGHGDKADCSQTIHSDVTHAFVFPLRITAHFKVDDLPCIVRFQHNPHSRQSSPLCRRKGNAIHIIVQQQYITISTVHPNYLQFSITYIEQLLSNFNSLGYRAQDLYNLETVIQHDHLHNIIMAYLNITWLYYLYT